MTSIFKLFTVAILILFCSSCSDNKTSDLSISYDEAAGFIQHPSIVNNQSHNGKLSVCVNPDQVYGVCYKVPFGLVTSASFSKINVSAWVYTESKESDGDLVVAIDSIDNNIFRSAVNAKSFNPAPGKWTLIKTTIDFNKKNKPSNKLVIYPFNTGKGKIWFDDIQIDFVQ